MPTNPSLPTFSAFVAGIFNNIEAEIAEARAAVEAAFPGSGSQFDQVQAAVAAAKADMDTATIARLFLSELGQAFATGRAVISHKPTDLAG